MCANAVVAGEHCDAAHSESAGINATNEDVHFKDEIKTVILQPHPIIPPMATIY